jgi:hypothetical protein
MARWTPPGHSSVTPDPDALQPCSGPSRGAESRHGHLGRWWRVGRRIRLATSRSPRARSELSVKCSVVWTQTIRFVAVISRRTLYKKPNGPRACRNPLSSLVAGGGALLSPQRATSISASWSSSNAGGGRRGVPRPREPLGTPWRTASQSPRTLTLADRKPGCTAARKTLLPATGRCRAPTTAPGHRERRPDSPRPDRAGWSQNPGSASRS